VDYRVLTVSREFGSGGGRIAKIVAEKLGWKLFDRELIEEIACAAKVDPRIVTEFDERPETWMGRLNRHALRSAAMAAGISHEEEHCFDPDEMARMTHEIVEQAYVKGDCVIVGRGAQCILQDRKDAFHVFVYAPFRERVCRLRSRLGSGINFEERIYSVDGARADYLQQIFGKTWNDPHLYSLMISSSENEDATAEVILTALNAARFPAPSRPQPAAFR